MFPHKIYCSQKIDQLIEFIFLFLFFISGFYIVPFFQIDLNLTLIKHYIFVLFILLMLLKLNLKKAIKENPSKILGFLFFLYLVNWLFRHVYNYNYLQLSLQIIFIFVFYNYSMQQGEKTLFSLLSIFNRLRIFIFFLIFVFFIFNNRFAHLMLSGFGNGRVLFSVWLGQFVILTYMEKYIKKNRNKKLENLNWFKNIITVIPIIILQTFLASRTGIIFSLFVILYFTYFSDGFIRALRAFLLFLFVIFASQAFLFPLQNYGFRSQSIERNITLNASIIEQYRDNSNKENKPFSNSIVIYADIALSGRLSVIKNSFNTLELKDYFLGKGLGNFKGNSDFSYKYEDNYDVHNIFLRTFGEFGLFGLVSLMLLLCYVPIIQILKIKKLNKIPCELPCDAIFILFIYTLIACTQPVLMVYSISPCLLYWVLYTQLMRFKVS